MSRSYDCADDQGRKDGIADAASTVRKGELVVLPTDTVYGIGADAFSPAAVASLLKAKGRGRDMPPPVLVGSVRAAHALIDDLGGHGQDLIDEFWPGPLTIVCQATPSLSWDLGDTKGTVAVRMPMHPVAIELLKETGPMAVSSANLSGRPAATRAEEAAGQLGDAVSVYLDGGPCEGGVPSTIVDLTYAVPRVLRSGAIPIERLRAVCGTVIGEAKPRRRPDPEPEAEPGEGAASEAESGAQSGADAGAEAGTGAGQGGAQAADQDTAAQDGPQDGSGRDSAEPADRRSE
ncbi:L-threonylcarbamoyladenylate synthase [Nocardiopsis composta]|uniref:L-threonylcarbamoyladenylate synthase n=1 Tax=Nocardiopsis composta TaxID=157465 RepID=A0A7W8QLL9_9ACTN|nr:L-threonylcarbamoyladenylate synthase [Nocardiopsis composta]MBB5432707.1 tRNA threonylcarbamoyl adenosine modification protein (Sua5/YciO/YrdC/YwlC family) [Nocardiopsis composta]